jgi:hypothetical protein
MNVLKNFYEKKGEKGAKNAVPLDKKLRIWYT